MFSEVDIMKVAVPETPSLLRITLSQFNQKQPHLVSEGSEIDELLRSIPGVKFSAVDSDHGSIVVQYDHRSVTANALLQKLKSRGFLSARFSARLNSENPAVAGKRPL
jgi:hypothetical protein